MGKSCKKNKKCKSKCKCKKSSFDDFNCCSNYNSCNSCNSCYPFNPCCPTGPTGPNGQTGDFLFNVYTGTGPTGNVSGPIPVTLGSNLVFWSNDMNIQATTGSALIQFSNNGSTGSNVNIYNSDGTLTGNRIVDQNNLSLDFINSTHFSINEYFGTTGMSGSGTGVQFLLDDVNFAGTNFPGIGIAKTLGSPLDLFACALVRSNNQDLADFGYFDRVNVTSNRVQAKKNTVEIASRYQNVGGSDEVITMDGNGINGYGLTGQTIIDSAAIVLSRPLILNNRGNTALTRNSSTGIIEEIQVINSENEYLQVVWIDQTTNQDVIVGNSVEFSTITNSFGSSITWNISSPTDIILNTVGTYEISWKTNIYILNSSLTTLMIKGGIYVNNVNLLNGTQENIVTLLDGSSTPNVYFTTITSQIIYSSSSPSEIITLVNNGVNDWRFVFDANLLTPGVILTVKKLN